MNTNENTTCGHVYGSLTCTESKDHSGDHVMIENDKYIAHWSRKTGKFEETHV